MAFADILIREVWLHMIARDCMKKLMIPGILILIFCLPCHAFNDIENRVLIDAWHIPSETIPSGPSMRDPLYPVTGGPVDLYLGFHLGQIPVELVDVIAAGLAAKVQVIDIFRAR